MTDKVNPSKNRPAESFVTAGAIAYGGHGGDGFVVDGANPTEIVAQDTDLNEANMNAFDETSGADSLDVDIDAGEAFVFGSWLAIDTSTTVTLDASTAGQTVYVGWNKEAADDVIVGLASAFGADDQRIPLWTFDTDGSGVTATTDERRIGYTQEATTFTGGVNLNDNSIVDVDAIRTPLGITIGVNADAQGDDHLAIGEGATTDSSGGVNQTAIGSQASVTEQKGTAVGYAASVTGSTGAVAVGRQSSASGSNSVALGRDSSATVQNAVAIGIGVTASNDNTVTLGDLVEIDEFRWGTNKFHRGTVEAESNDQFEKPNIEAFTGSNSQRAAIALSNQDGMSFLHGRGDFIRISTGAASDGTGSDIRLDVSNESVEVFEPFRLDNVSSDPESPPVGSLWYRSDLD